MKALLTSLTTSSAGYSALALRIPVGIIFMAHGAQKTIWLVWWLWLRGHRRLGWNQIGLVPGFLMALMAGSAEFFGRFVYSTGLVDTPCSSGISFYHGSRYIFSTFCQWLIYVE